ncbi:MAG TPA: SusC/RagA family TonB-linked outer membrane protein, partial [Niabella sp.]|nr:SusC/RagA family TonB-linked outer membrane protein [Niabella sp.]
YNPYDVPVDQLIDPNTGKLNPSARLKWEDNWLDEVMANNPVRQEYQLDLSGGNSVMKSFASMNVLREDGLLKGTSFDRFTGRANTEFTPRDWFKTTLSANFSKGKSNLLNATGSSTSNVWYSAEQMAPIYPINERNADGSFKLDANGNRLYDYGLDRAAGAQQNFNSIAVLYDDKYYDERNNIGSRASVEFNTRDKKYGALQGFALSFNLGADYIDRAYTYYYNPYFGNAAGSGRLNKEWNKTFSYTFNQLLTWNRTINKHSFDVLAGHESYSYRFNLLSAQKTGFPFGGLYELAPGSSIADANSYENNETIESYLSRLQYNFNNKYYLSGSFRTDGSSRFFKDYRWGDFWSVGGAWKISEEEFLKNQTWLNSFTIKSSYGGQGNNQLLNSSNLQNYYAWQAFYDLTWNNANNNGGAVTSVENKKVSWEKIQSLNVGFDSRLLDNRLTVSFDWYTRKTTDMLLNRPLAMSLGFEGFNDNIGDMKNSGFDLSIGYDVIKNQNLVWNITAMGSRVRNKVLKLTDEQTEIISGTTIIRVGEEINSFYMARSAGVDPATGEQLYWIYDNKADELDRSKHYISSDKSKAAASRVLLGSRIPKLYGSLGTTLTYKKFDFALLTTYSIGGKVYDVVGYNYLNPLYIGNNFSREVLRAWKQPGDVTDIPRLQKEVTHTINDRALVDASYFAIKNISMGYTFNVNRIGLNSVRYFVQGDNLLMFAARQGLNPQFNFTGTTDYVFTPNRIITMGVNVNF